MFGTASSAKPAFGCGALVLPSIVETIGIDRPDPGAGIFGILVSACDPLDLLSLVRAKLPADEISLSEGGADEETSPSSLHLLFHTSGVLSLGCACTCCNVSMLGCRCRNLRP
jgi:hypothetical protein